MHCIGPTWQIGVQMTHMSKTNTSQSLRNQHSLFFPWVPTCARRGSSRSWAGRWTGHFPRWEKRRIFEEKQRWGRAYWWTNSEASDGCRKTAHLLAHPSLLGSINTPVSFCEGLSHDPPFFVWRNNNGGPLSYEKCAVELVFTTWCIF